MLETVQIGVNLLVNKFSYGVKNPFTGNYLIERDGPQIGDIIVFEYPGDPSVDYIKRVEGLPGDVIEVRDKELYRNGELIREDYVQHIHPTTIGRLDNIGPVTVPEGEYFVMGDNRDNSEDSRAWGTVKRKAIHGKAWRIYWSWDSEARASPPEPPGAQSGIVFPNRLMAKAGLGFPPQGRKTKPGLWSILPLKISCGPDPVFRHAGLHAPIGAIRRP